MLVSAWLILGPTLAMAAPPPTHRALPVEVEAVTPAPEPRLGPAIPYPDVAVKLGRTDDCHVRVSIDKKGRPERVTTVQCLSLFEIGSRVALRLWTWEPWTVDGRKVPHEFDVVLRYRLERLPLEADDPDVIGGILGDIVPDREPQPDEAEGPGEAAPQDPIVLDPSVFSAG